jgi:hypothetical protein
VSPATPIDAGLRRLHAGERDATRQLTSISDRLGYLGFLQWYQSRSIRLKENWGAQWDFFVESLRERLLSDRSLPVLAARDRDAVLLYAEPRIRISTSH